MRWLGRFARALALRAVERERARIRIAGAEPDWCHACHFCGAECWYMVSQEVWACEAELPHLVGCCVECLQREIGRRLTSADFPACPLNNPIVAMLAFAEIAGVS